MWFRVNRKKVTGTAASGDSHSDLLITSVICILLAGIVWVTFGQTLRHEFVNCDDGPSVYLPRIINGLTPGNVQWALIHAHAGNWHPLTWMSHMLDCQLYGLQPWGHHLTNILLHAAATILLFFALRELTGGDYAVAGINDAGRDHRSRLQQGDSLWPSAFVAALFAIHPMRVESVAWVAERKDVLSGVFFMLTLLAYARYARSDRFSLGRYTTVLVFFGLGLMCKQTLVTLPFVLLLLDYWPLCRIHKSEAVAERVRGALKGRTAPKAFARRPAWLHRSSWPRLVVEKTPFFVLSAAGCVATLHVQKGFIWALPLQQRFGNAMVAYVEYLGQTIYPAHLAFLYPYPEAGVSVAEVMFASLFLLAVSVIFFVCRKTYPFALTGWLWFLGMLVPMNGIIVQVGSQSRADHYTYLPAIGLYILATWGAIRLFDEWSPKREALAVAALLIIGALVARSYFQTSYWLNSETLWRHTIDVTSRNYIALENLAGALLEKEQLNEAIAYYREAVAIKPDLCDEKCVLLAQVQSNRGNALLREGQVDDAIVNLQKVLQMDPACAEAYNYMGSALMKKGQGGKAIRYYQAAVQLDTSYADAHNNLGVAFLRNGQRDEAVAHLREALRLKPGYEEARKQLRELGVTAAQ
jgi:tetratricopeptide (TPR) repeat protein